MKEIILQLIRFIHYIFVLFIIGAPFIGSNYILLLHAIIVPFMMIHWICNNNTCALTIVERTLRKQINKNKVDKDIEEDCITCKMIEPIYDFNKNYKAFSVGIYLITIGLFLISSGRLLYRYEKGSINNFSDLFIL